MITLKDGKPQGVKDGQFLILGWKSLGLALGDITDYRKTQKIAEKLNIKIVYIDGSPCASVRQVTNRIEQALMRE